ncbi:MAG: acylphosphatase, partial [Selenomonadaceae bacterium]
MFFFWRLLMIVTIFMTFPLAASHAAGLIEDVDIKVSANEGIPPLIQQRMQSSVRTISEELFIGSPIDRVASQQVEYESIIQQVFDKILVGYSVKNVVIESAPKMKVLVELTPWAETIHDIQVSVDVEGLPLEIKALAAQDLAGVEEVFRQSLLGLPVDATDWSNGVLKRTLNEYMETNLPEFRADFDLEPGPVARIKMVVYPKGPVIRTLDLQMRSDTVPNLLLLECRSQLQKQADI